ncbi:MAG: methylated-DNA--[protein]-cysteine S-methyltransferase [Chloroflexota bacterium]
MADTGAIHLRSYDSPVGRYYLLASRRRLVYLGTGVSLQRHITRWQRLGTVLSDDRALLDAAVRQLDDYFGGGLRTFTVPLDLCGTAFQQAVWTAVSAIPYGETRSYGELAADLGRCLSARAVGQANARNPISIIIPCHRVIGSDGSLVGYGGGLDRKRALLDLEARVLRGDTSDWPPTAPAPTS